MTHHSTARGATSSSFIFAALFLALAGTANAQDVQGYLNSSEALHIEAWLPPLPPQNSLAQAADIEAYFSERQLIGTPRGDQAAADDVYAPSDVAPRFADALAASLDPGHAPRFFALMVRVQRDSEVLMAPVKKSVAEGGRHRPFVDYPGRPICPIVYAQLPATGSYPSGHAAIGWLWGAILAEAAPERADALLARGIAFGDSRVVCGFHYPSDVAASRLAAAALLQRLHGDADFLRDLRAAEGEIRAARRSRTSR